MTARRLPLYALTALAFSALLFLSQLPGKPDGGDPAVFARLSRDEQLAFLRGVVENRGALAGWEFLKAEASAADDPAGGDHALAHFVGEELHRELGVAAIAFCEPIFNYGCYHGLLGRALAIEGIAGLTRIRDTCYTAQEENLSRGVTGSGGCIHGIGHGLAEFRGLDYRAALKDCLALKESEQSPCWNGVFMEYFTSAPALAFSQNEPWRVCTGLPEPYRETCGLYLPIVMRQKFHLDDAEAAGVCLEAPDHAVRESCLHYLGVMLANRFPGDTQRLEEECSLFGENGRDDCLIGATEQTVLDQRPDASEAATRLCAAVTPESLSRCKEVARRRP